jgi:hypothetical protein
MANTASGSGEPPQSAQGPENPQASLQTVGDALASQVGEETLDAFLDAAMGDQSAPEPPPDQQAQAEPVEEEGIDHSQVNVEAEEEPSEQIPTGIQKRLDSLFARTKKAEEEVARLKQELKVREAEPAARPAENEPDPVEALPQVRTLKEQEDKKRGLLTTVRQWQRQMRRDPDTVLKQIREAGIQLQNEDPDEVSDWLLNAADRITEDLGAIRGKREAVVTQERGRVDAARQQLDKVALERWPWINDSTSDKYQVAQRILATRPWLKREAAFLPFLAMATEFLLDLQQPKAPAARPAPRPPGVRPPGTPSAAIPGRPGGREARMAAADKLLLENPSDDALNEYLEAMVD